MMPTEVSTWLGILAMMPLLLVGVRCVLYPPKHDVDKKWRYALAWGVTFLLAVGAILHTVPRAGWGNILVILVAVLALVVGTLPVLNKALYPPEEGGLRRMWYGDSPEAEGGDSIEEGASDEAGPPPD